MYKDLDNAAASESQEQYSNTGIKDQLGPVDQLKLLKAATLDSELSRADLAVFACIVDGIDKKTGSWIIARPTLVGKVGVNDRTVGRAIAKLKERRWLHVEERIVPLKDRKSSNHKDRNLSNVYWPNFDRLKEETTAPKVETRQGRKKPQTTPVQAAASPAVEPKQTPVVTIVKTPAPISNDNDNTKPDFSDIQNIRTVAVSIRYYELKFPHIADDLHVLHAHLKEMDPEAGKIGNEHHRREWVLAELGKRDKLACMLQTQTKAA